MSSRVADEHSLPAPLALIFGGAAELPLEARGAPGAIVAGEPCQSSAVLHMDGPVTVGVWACTVGAWRARYEKTEFFHILSGLVTLEPDDGDSFSLGAGAVCCIPAGWAGTWRVTEAVRKIWITCARTTQ